MEMRLSRVKLCLFFLTAVFMSTAVQAFEAYSSEKLIRIYADSGTIKREITGESLFEKALMPGDEVTAGITIENKLNKPIIYEIKCASASNNSLYKALRLSVANSNGDEIYKGDLKSFNVLIGPQKSQQNEKLKLSLSLLREADNSTAGQRADFSFIVIVRSEVDYSANTDNEKGDSGQSSDTGSGSDSGKNSGSGSSSKKGSGSGSGGDSTGGTGRGAVDTGTGGGSLGGAGENGLVSTTEGTKTNGTVTEAGDVISGSSFDRGFSFEKDGSLISTGTDGKTVLIRSGFLTGAAAGNGVSVYSDKGHATYEGIDISRPGIDNGSWQQDKDGFWRYVFNDGTYLKNGFAPIMLKTENAAKAADTANKYYWYYFDEKGHLAIGWIRYSDNRWYHSHEEADAFYGAIETGWIYSKEDKALYYLSEIDAVMKTGWIGFKSSDKKSTEYYYLARLSDTYRQNWFFNTGVGRWLYDKLGYRSYGSMYRAEKTPDGYTVGTDGRWKE